MVYSESELKILNEATKLIALDTQLVERLSALVAIHETEKVALPRQISLNINCVKSFA